MARKDDLGRAGERVAEAYLRGLGFEVLDRNWRCRAGEVDLVVADAATVVVVEVKTRRSLAFGHPFEAIDPRKLRRLHLLAHHWRAAHPELAAGRGIRIDGLAIVGDGIGSILEGGSRGSIGNGDSAGTGRSAVRIEHLRDLS